ncbi:MAG: tRNA 2-thiouridine(34) synthase MnmA [Dehalococcoidia bacterium]|jgi:tRNA-specific 2-thiouridylase|nr:tRNA 2-thiouridine(34) synthase MnmA [Dehalococcoidia bacterium]MDP6227389.1 tRNA 2-thiouridine(34) synthase MnmA [Dehalococcoidia bacterium]MDP7200552.1 tRNA 2-thiouridine(34) synthase MnmA [Dehalococcoidia bacterium]MDP7511817.1 tRNA 2-thiouridine(34) synthase MnmA [Dehalococcoidia bacterium]HJN86805.1 tRNA 2-thiouridine(34) synthase MnmA [Dehalococcoidia bacterium]
MVEKVAVAMSGGVDSSVAALLLQQQGYQVVGVTMKLYGLEHTDLPKYYKGCCTVGDVVDARTVCRRLGVPHYVLNVQQEFQAHVIDYFCSEYQNGRTPHPCIACNDKIKFNFLMTRAVALQADYVATGHYAIIERTPDGMVLKKAVDHGKDQSYVLFGMGQPELARTLMPVGAYPKDTIRQMAEDAGLGVARKPDSQDICFVPFGDYRAFLKGRVPSVPGSIVNQEGEQVGRHQGIESFTVGQRRGLGIGNREPCYVLRLEPEANRVVVGPEEALYQTRMWTSRVNYTLGRAPDGPVEVGVKIRYKSEEARAVLHPRPEGALVCFEQPQRAVTPGQAAVFYRGDVLLGGGTIERDIPGGETVGNPFFQERVSHALPKEYLLDQGSNA